MDKATLKALKGSIAKWGRIVRSTQAVDDGPDNCPLCKLFWVDGCVGCPVAKKAKKSHCYNTPYTKWGTHHVCHDSEHVKREPGCDECLRLAKAEHDFLKSLLPKRKAADRQ